MEAKAKRKRKAERTKIDPTTFTVILNAFQTITREMTLAFEYTAWTTIISDARDFSCAIYDAQARQVAMLDAIPIHTNSMSIVINEIARTFEGDIHEGDLIICNDPYSGNTHVGDLVMACPVFHKKQHLFWTVTKAHHLDSGAPIPSSMPQTATDVWTEGLTIPPFKIYDKGVERKDAIRLILAHWRWPWATGGDLRAQMGTVWLGRKRLLELIESYGVETIKRYVEEMIDYADRMTAAEIRDFPDGTYVGYTWIDSDGQGRTDIPIKATVTIKDDMVHVDFTGSSPQTPGAVNASYAVMRAAAGIPVLTCVDSAIPHNEGCIKHIVGTAPKGTVATAEWPYSTALCTICCGDALQEAVMRALAHAVPELRSAGIGRIVVPAMSGEDRRGEQPTLYGVQLFNAGPGGGASKGYDGWPVINDAAVMGGLKLIAIELCELLYPLLFEHYEMETDSAGAGRWRGAPGVRMSIRPVAGPMEFDHYGDGMQNPPFGMLGGKPGIGGGHFTIDTRTGKRIFYSANARFILNEHEVWTLVSSGGGGYGSPLEREPEKVREDVRDELVSLEAAREVFGVVLNPDTLEVDREATEALRAELRAKEKREVVTPTHPNASTWVQENMREGEEYKIDYQEAGLIHTKPEWYER